MILQVSRDRLVRRGLVAREEAAPDGLAVKLRSPLAGPRNPAQAYVKPRSDLGLLPMKLSIGGKVF